MAVVSIAMSLWPAMRIRDLVIFWISVFQVPRIVLYCGNVKQGKDKLTLKDRTYRCDACGRVMDRDLNAAMNLRREGLYVLGMIHDHELNEERSRGTASGSASADKMPVETPPPGRVPSRHPDRCGSMKQESRMSDIV